MQTITTNVLETVSGGASKSSEISSAISALGNEVKSIAANKNSSSSMDPTMMLVLAMTMGQKSSGPTVVSAGAPAAPVVAGGPIVNISTRVRRGW